MYEFQVDHARLSPSELPEDIKAEFKDSDADLAAIALLPWAEHCTECAMPQCFQTCDLYTSRKDGKCRCFINGISPITDVPNLLNYVVRINFKRFACLMAYTNSHMVPVNRAKLIERISFYADKIILMIPDEKISLFGRRGISSRLMVRLKDFVTSNGLFAHNRLFKPDYLLVEVYNPGTKTINLSLTIRNPDGDQRKFPYQKLLSLQPGFNRFKVPYVDINDRINTEELMTITFNPNINDEGDEGLTLYFGLLTFVTDNKYRAQVVDKEFQHDEMQIVRKRTQSKKMIKIVAWDLDNTIWKGILVEDGPDKIALKPGVKDIIQELDRRGIVNSVVSKNNPDQALEQLERFGLIEYMVFPKIGWGPKGEAVKELIRDFNVGEDTIAFIDDSPFEREQVQASNQKVRVYSEKEYLNLINFTEFNPQISEESSNRRKFYQSQSERIRDLNSFSGEYINFLANCQIKLNINPVVSGNLDRIHELVQRTNQLNFSGNRYTRGDLNSIIESERFDHYCLDCNDKYGEYGIVGFAVVDKEISRLTDLMFSCRVQAKRVEHAFMIFLLNYYKNQKVGMFEAEYFRTDRNEQAGKVFSDLGFYEKSLSNGKYLYCYDLSNDLPKNEVIKIAWQGIELNL